MLSYQSKDKREKRLRDLSSLLRGINRADMELTMGQLSLEFYRQAALTEGYVHGGDIAEAEGHKLIAEAIHDILGTFEIKRREEVEAEVTPNVTDNTQRIKEKK